jgi:cell division septum initiation protein DivIVA
MSNKIPELLEMLHNMISEAWGLPLGAEKCVIERDQALDLLDDIKRQFPTEIAEARRLLDARTEFLNNVKREAETVRRATEDRARQLINEQEIIRIAKAKSNEMLSSAEKSSTELRRVANEYVDEMMKRAEEDVTSLLEEIRQTRLRFRQAAQAARVAAQQAPQQLPQPDDQYDEDDDDYDE